MIVTADCPAVAGTQVSRGCWHLANKSLRIDCYSLSAFDKLNNQILSIDSKGVNVLDKSNEQNKSFSIDCESLKVMQDSRSRVVIGRADLVNTITKDEIKTEPNIMLFDKDGNVTYRAK